MLIDADNDTKIRIAHLPEQVMARETFCITLLHLEMKQWLNHSCSVSSRQCDGQIKRILKSMKVPCLC